eukprot:TRINITY_DN13884_c0_g3_i1.p1 TRINITY_DN13884_c0_g3~~TRINITY_DN13884_c0_g3_i1.p1  ORF type:complete len:286 (+),score=28.04 TRINITY_DN13884_c0_g3_i1:22-879(+)
MMPLHESMGVAVVLEYGNEQVFRFTPKPGKSEFVARALRKHLSKMLAVISDHVDTSAKHELRMYQFIASAVAGDSCRIIEEPDTDMEAAAHCGIITQSEAVNVERHICRDAVVLQKPAENSRSSSHPNPAFFAHTSPATSSGAPVQAESLPPHLRRRSYTVPSRVDQENASRLDEYGFPVGLTRGPWQPPSRPPGSSNFGRRGNYVRPQRVAPMDLSDFVVRHPEAVCHPEDVHIAIAASGARTHGELQTSAGSLGGPKADLAAPSEAPEPRDVCRALSCRDPSM